MSAIERCCIVATADKHLGLEKNLEGLPVDMDIYLRDAEDALDVRGYIDLVQDIEARCFSMPSKNWVLAHFALTGPGMMVTAEIDREPVAAQYVAADCWDGRTGLRFWTTVVDRNYQGLKIATLLTGLSTYATRSWATFGGAICDTDSGLMGRNAKLNSLVVTANMHHTPGRTKVQVEWPTPKKPFEALRQPTPFEGDYLPTLTSLLVEGEIPNKFLVSPEADIWEEIAHNPDRFRRYFRLIGFARDTKISVLQIDNT